MIDGNHENHVEFRNQSLANIDNENSVAAPQGTLTDYDEKMQCNRETNYIECHCGKLCNGNRLRNLKSQNEKSEITTQR